MLTSQLSSVYDKQLTVMYFPPPPFRAYTNTPTCLAQLLERPIYLRVKNDALACSYLYSILHLLAAHVQVRLSFK